MLFANVFFSPDISKIVGYFISILFVVLLVIYEILGNNHKTKKSRILLIPYIIVLGTIFLYTILNGFIYKI
ncbi:MAG TPA: hypothetical protein VLG12_07725 [Candidatus Saccharimonadales bacterium]|nr:hypothetical protein [Candidatus Saccharimonadales bacterium]